MPDNYLPIFIHNILYIIGEVGGGFALFVFLLRLINHNSKKILANHGGTFSQVLFGGIGIIIHEFSHLIVAIIFGHHIDKFRLIKLPHPPTDMTMGYVNHSFNPKSIYQKVGNFFIGIAPIGGCSLVITMLTNWLTPGLTNTLTMMLMKHQILKMPPINWWHACVLIFLITNINIGGFDLSRADLENTKSGAILTITLLILIIAGLSWLMNYNSLFFRINHLAFPIFLILLFSLFTSILTNLGLRIFFDH